MAGRYRIVDLALWSDPVVEKLTSEEKLLFLYLITGPASHMSGIYKLRIGQIVADTGLSEKGVRRGIEGGSMGLLALYDDEFAVVWVVNMLAHQGRGANIAKHVGAHLLTLHNCPLIKDFLSRYEEMEIPYSNPLRTPFDGGVPQEQEQEQDQEQTSMSSPVDLTDVNPKVKLSRPTAEQVAAVWDEVMPPANPRPTFKEGKLCKGIRRDLTANIKAQDYTMEDWAGHFTAVRDAGWTNGNDDRGPMGILSASNRRTVSNFESGDWAGAQKKGHFAW